MASHVEQLTSCCLKSETQMQMLRAGIQNIKGHYYYKLNYGLQQKSYQIMEVLVMQWLFANHGGRFSSRICP